MNAERYSVAVNPNPVNGEISVLFSGYEATKPAHNVGPQVLDYFLLHHVLGGKGTFHCMGKTYKLEAGDSFFIFPGELIRYTADEHEPWIYRWVGFRGTRAAELLNQLGISQFHCAAKPSNHRRAGVYLARIERALMSNEPGAGLRAEGLMRMLLSEYAGDKPWGTEQQNRKRPIEQQIERSIRWLSLQYAQPVSIEQMAQALGYNRTHLSRMFKRYTGMSPMNYLLKIRMEKAKLLLKENLTIEQVASSVGFSDPLYFSKQFKKWCGQSPSEYRNNEHETCEYICLR
jgi:AraC-like DNA-binding protein